MRGEISLFFRWVVLRLIVFGLVVWVFGFIIGFGYGQSTAYNKTHDKVTVEKIYSKHKNK